MAVPANCCVLRRPQAARNHRAQNGTGDRCLFLAGREISIDHQSRFALDDFARLEGVAIRSSSPALPHDGGSDGLTGAPVPNHGGFTLIGDPDGSDFSRLYVCRGECAAPGLQLRPSDGISILFDPSGLRIITLDWA